MKSTIVDSSVTAINITRLAVNAIVQVDDLVACEEPLEIILSWQVNGEKMHKNISVTMRTPGDDAALAAGFLFTEAIVNNADAIAAVNNPTLNANQIVVHLKDGVIPNLQQTERNFYTSSSCGVCGKASIDAIKTVSSFGYLKSDTTIAADLLYELPQKLRVRQQTFDQTGGLHAAALFSNDGDIKLVQEDVGRHNALDKLIGTALMKNQLPLATHILLLSGRASFELIQKATMAGIGIVAAVGAPSSLAVQLAHEAGITLVGFLRSNGCNIYAHPARIIFNKKDDQ